MCSIFPETPAELSKWKTENDSCCAELYIGFFEFYSLAFQMSDYAVSIRKPGGVSKEEKGVKSVIHRFNL